LRADPERDAAEDRRAAFPKFWNWGEFARPVPSGPFECFEKADGSLIIIFHDGQR
jgi:hypothetical protein